MANKLVLKAKKIFLGGRYISDATNRIAMDAPIEEVDSTNFGSAAKEAEPGLESSTAQVGIMLPDDFDLEGALFDARGTGVLATFFVEGNSAGDVAWSVHGLSTKHYPGAQIGQLLSTTVELASHGVPTIRGQVLEDDSVQFDEGDANGANYLELTGGVDSSQRLTLVVHLVELTGITALDISLESDVDNVFGGPTTRITLDTFDDIGAQRGTVDGAITDEFFRLAFAPTGTGTFKVAAVLALAAQ